MKKHSLVKTKVYWVLVFGVLSLFGTQGMAENHVKDGVYYIDNPQNVAVPSEIVTKIVFDMTGTYSAANNEWSGEFTNHENDADSWVKQITEIDMSGLTNIDGNWKFKGFTTLKTIKWPSAITVIPEDAFAKSAIEELTIPATVTEVQARAFSECKDLHTVTIQPSEDHTFIIKNDAFNNSKAIKSVILPKTYQIDGKTYPQCEYGAFDYDVTDGQTTVRNLVSGNCGALVLPEVDNESEEVQFANYDWYVGQYKEGLVLTNHNDIVTSREDYAEKATDGNAGWWQFFMSTTSNIIPVPSGKDFIRTFSDPRPYQLPKGELKVDMNDYNSNKNGIKDRYPEDSPNVRIEGNNIVITDDAIMAYRVINYTDEGKMADRNAPVNPKVTVLRIESYVPSETGVILRSNSVSEDRVYYFQKYTGEEKKYPYNSIIADADVNLLHHSMTSVAIHPTDRGGLNQFDMKQPITHRNFGFTTNSKYSASTEAPKFVRLQNTNTKENRAYLKLTAQLYPYSDETADGGPGTQVGAKTFSVNAAPAKAPSTIQTVGIQGFEDIPAGMVVISKNHPSVYGEATGVVSLESEVVTDNNYYTLQGMRVDRPVKGIYIKNGKKFLVK